MCVGVAQLTSSKGRISPLRLLMTSGFRSGARRRSPFIRSRMSLWILARSSRSEASRRSSWRDCLDMRMSVKPVSLVEAFDLAWLR